MTWTENEDGPTCSCGEVTVVKQHDGQWLALCLFHTGAEGAYTVLPDEERGGIMGPHEKWVVPAQETRGGKRVDWAKAKPGEALPELPPDAYPEPDSTLINPDGPTRDPHATGALWDDDTELGGED